MIYKIEVLTKTVNPISREIVEAWEPIHPSNGAPYTFDTEQEAKRVFNSTFPRGSKARLENKVQIVKYER
jgi:hypothetical protein